MSPLDSIAYCHLLKPWELEKGQWAFPDREAAERGISPSGPHWDQHNMSAWSRYITRHQRLQKTHCVSHRTGQATERTPAAAREREPPLPPWFCFVFWLCAIWTKSCCCNNCGFKSFSFRTNTQLGFNVVQRTYILLFWSAPVQHRGKAQTKYIFPMYSFLHFLNICRSVQILLLRLCLRPQSQLPLWVETGCLQVKKGQTYTRHTGYWMSL